MKDATTQIKSQAERSRGVVYLLETHPLAARYLAERLGSFSITVLPERQSIESGLAKSPPAKNSAIAVVHRDTATGFSAAIHSLQKALPGVRILVLGEFFAISQMCQMLLAGCHGFLTYERIEDVTAAIQTLLAGHVWAVPEVLEEFALNASVFMKSKPNQGAPFTEREVQVLEMVEKRLSNKQVAAALGITERTVRFHLRNIFAKLGVHDRYSVVEFVRSQNADSMHGSKDKVFSAGMSGGASK